MVLKVAFEDIPSDPTRDIYRQGGTLGEEYKHWFRAKFLQRFRLFFRYRLTAKIQPVSAQSLPDHASKESELRSTNHIGVRFAPKVAIPASSIFGRFETCRPAGTMSVPGGRSEVTAQRSNWRD